MIMINWSIQMKIKKIREINNQGGLVLELFYKLLQVSILSSSVIRDKSSRIQGNYKETNC